MTTPTAPLSTLIEDGALSYGIVQPGQHDFAGVPIVRVKDLAGGSIDLRSPLRVAAAVSDRHNKTMLRGGELLVSLVGSVGIAAIAPPELAGWNVARAIGVIRPRAGVSPYWLKLCFETPTVQAQIRAVLNTTVQATLNLADAKRLQLPLPEPSDRDAIAAVLGALDDKIVSNSAVALTAHELARATFRASTATSALIALTSLAAPILGGTPDRQNPLYWGDGHFWASARDVSNAPTGVLLRTAEQITSAAIQNRRTRPHRPGTTVLTARGTVGAVARLAEPSAINQSCYAFEPVADRSALTYLAVLEAVQRMRAMAHGSVFSTITTATLDGIMVPEITEVAATTSDLTESLLDLVSQHERENLTLAELRDALLPALMSGRLRVKDAERVVEDAV